MRLSLHHGINLINLGCFGKEEDFRKKLIKDLADQSNADSRYPKLKDIFWDEVELEYNLGIALKGRDPNLEIVADRESDDICLQLCGRGINANCPNEECI